MDSQEFARHFAFEFKEYDNPIGWSDAIGLSRVKHYSNGFASIFKIGFMRNEPESAAEPKKLWASISYGRQTDMGISVSEGNKLTDPIDLNFADEFFYDTQTKKFYRGSQEISSRRILEFVEDAHIRPTKRVRGSYLRVRLFFWRKILPSSVRFIDNLLSGLLWIISGEKVNGDILNRLVRGYLKDKPESAPIDTTIHKGKTMEFFGYQAKRWSVIFYCALHLGLFFIAIKYFTTIYVSIAVNLENSLLAVCYVVVSFAITEAGLPALLKAGIERLPKLFEKAAFKSIKVT